MDVPTLQELIDECQESLAKEYPGSIEYNKKLEHLSELYKLKSQNRIGSEAWLNAGVHLLGILLVLNFETFGVITSKAFGMLRRSK